ncbi:hypothetical protein JXA63_04130 [Candidatus Woesebacteria bacterium]|nr:hypothetical protein [Candidatus Woesebacteria bacterium]
MSPALKIPIKKLRTKIHFVPVLLVIYTFLLIAWPENILAQEENAPRCVCVDPIGDGCACTETDTYGGAVPASIGEVQIICANDILANSFFNVANPACGNNAEIIPSCSRVDWNPGGTFAICWGTTFFSQDLTIPADTNAGWVTINQNVSYGGWQGYVSDVLTCESNVYCCGTEHCTDEPQSYGTCPAQPGGAIPGSPADEACGVAMEPYYGTAESRLWFPHARSIHVLSTMAQTMFNPRSYEPYENEEYFEMYEESAFSKTSTQAERASDNGEGGRNAGDLTFGNKGGFTARIDRHQSGYNSTDNNSTAIVGEPVPGILSPYYYQQFPGADNACYIEETFTNPGDDLIGAKIKAEMLFTGFFEVPTKGMPVVDGRVCTEDGGQFEISYACHDAYNNMTAPYEYDPDGVASLCELDCCSANCIVHDWSIPSGRCQPLEAVWSEDDEEYILPSCSTLYPGTYTEACAQQQYSSSDCSSTGVRYYCCQPSAPDAPGYCVPPDTVTVECGWEPFESISIAGEANIFNKTPLIEAINDTILEGNDSLFRRFMPKIDGIFDLDDIPTKTNIIATANVVNFYETLEHTSADLSTFNLEYAKGQVQTPVMYIPHLGSLYKYWLVDFQNALRPEEFSRPFMNYDDEPLAYQNPGDAPSSNSEDCRGGSGVYRCDQYAHLTIGPCSVDNLEQVFLSINPSDQLAHDKACLASKICNRESGGNPRALNTGCVTGGTCDYSAGLFQYNYIIPGRCPGGMEDYSCSPTVWCTVENQETLDACVDQQFDPDFAIQTMLRLSSNGTSWCDWQLSSGCVVCNY